MATLGWDTDTDWTEQGFRMAARFDINDDRSDRAARPAAGRAAVAGATLLYGPKSSRPDLILVAQFLIDDLRAEGTRIAGVQVNAHTLRLRIDGAELALALSAGPLPARSLQGLRRPATNARLTPGLDARSTLDGAQTAGAMLTDLGTIRVMRALRQHQAALGVLLRRRGLSGPADLDATLQLLLQTLAEAAPPTLMLWQRSGVVFTGCEFAAASLADLTRTGGPAQVLSLPDRFEPFSDRDLSSAEPMADPPALDRATRAERRSAGRLFRRDTDPAEPDSRKGPARSHIATTLPRLATANLHLAEALRTPSEPPANLPQPATRRLGTKMLLGLWFALILPNWVTLQAVLAP